MSATKAILAQLRESLRTIEGVEHGFGDNPALFTIGLGHLDTALGGGLSRTALHEILAIRAADGAAASGFALALALRASESKRKLVWARQDMAATELGDVHPPGLAELGADPDRFILVRCRDAVSVLRAGNEALRASGLGAVIIETWGDQKALDLTATQRLARAAARSGVAAFLLRITAKPAPSAALTRWSLRAAASAPLEARAPGLPTFTIELLRHRAGIPPQNWHLEWDRDALIFREPALSRAVAASASDRPAAPAAQGDWRRAG